MDGIFPTDYAIDTAHGRLGSHRCGGSLPGLVHEVVPPKGFTYAAAFTVRSHDASYEGEPGERTMDTLWPSTNDAGHTGKTRAYQGADTWYRDDIYFPSGFKPTRNTDWNVVFQLHNYPDNYGDVNLDLSVVMDNADLVHGAYNAGRLSTRVIGGASPENPIDARDGSGDARYTAASYKDDRAVRWHWIAGPRIRRRHWYHFVWHVHWDWRPKSDGGRGFVEYWVDGRKIGTYRGPTLFFYANNETGHSGPGQAYLSDGYYRPTNGQAGYEQPTVTVYHAGTMLGPNAASIGAKLR